MRPLNAFIVGGLAAMALGGCARDGEIDPTGGVTVTRSACPSVGIPAQTGDITLFNPPASRDSRAIDVTAYITNLRSTCVEGASEYTVNATFEIRGRRNSASGAREVVVPYFATVVQGGRVVVSKRVSRVALRFADGQLLASATGAGSATVNRGAATLPAEIQQRITRKRKAGDADAAIDPMADPQVREAVARTSFELLVGFQLTSEQLRYNATR